MQWAAVILLLEKGLKFDILPGIDVASGTIAGTAYQAFAGTVGLMALSRRM